MEQQVQSPGACPFLQALHVDVLRLPRCSRQWSNRRTCIGRLCRPWCGLVARWFDFLNESCHAARSNLAMAIAEKK